MSNTCKYCQGSGSVPMVCGIYVTSFACTCPKGDSSRACGLQSWNGHETQEYQGKVYRFMWAKTAGLPGQGVQDHFPTSKPNGQGTPAQNVARPP